MERSHLHQAGCHVACGLARLVGDVGHHLDDLAWSVTLHVSLGLQHHGARFHQHVAELFGHLRRGDSLRRDQLAFFLFATRSICWRRSYSIQVGVLQTSRDKSRGGPLFSLQGHSGFQILMKGSAR